MSRKDAGLLLGLGLTGIWIWCRDLAWWAQASSTLPILLSLAWYAWLVSPWEQKNFPSPVPPIAITSAVLLLLAGTLTNLTLVLAIAWAIALRAWIQSRFSARTLAKANRLLILTIMAFPWMALDGDMVSTIFRLSAAQFTESTFSLLGLVVERSGTNLWIQGLPVSVNEACSGLGVLQAAMIAGVVLLEGLIPNKNRVWIQIPLLIATAWCANTLRVIVISFAALTWGTEFAAGPFHTWGGISALLLVFGIAWMLIEWQQSRATP